ncbi:MAG TPA: nuclear transport factor 2 family protein [Solirubrobacterales bacterium]|nr:nuclear transport factor 2 family protein [Solirubrobacterales bacterium]
MSQENVDWIRRMFDEFGWSPAGIEEASRAGLVAPNVELDFSALYFDGPVVRGLEEWRRAFADTAPWGRSLTFEPERFFEIDDERVLVFMRVTARGEGSGVPVENRVAHEYTIRDGVLARWKGYADRSQALEAAGLRE